jgi:hypothetical protein
MTNVAQTISAGPAPEAARRLLAAANLPTSDLTDEDLTSFFYCGPADAHFNPAVSAIQALRGRLSWPDAGLYTVVQIAGCCFGALLAHANPRKKVEAVNA